MKLWIVTAIVVLGVIVTLGTSVEACRNAIALKRTGKNGMLWTYVTGDLFDEALRLFTQGGLAVLLVRALFFVPTPQASWTWRNWLMAGVLVAISAQSVNRWWMRRTLLRALDRD